MRVSRFAFAGLVGVTVALGGSSLLSGCGGGSQSDATQAQESPEAQREAQRIEDAIKSNKGLPKAAVKGAVKGAPRGAPKAVRD